MMGLNGLSAILAAIGGIAFILVVVGSILFGRKIGDEESVAPPTSVVGTYGSAGTLQIPGTVVLVGIFFISFVLYYFVNWKYLSEVWPLN
jgi:cytochrome c oxidase subunit 1